jgi:hypothetical protein
MWKEGKRREAKRRAFGCPLGGRGGIVRGNIVVVSGNAR